MGKKLSLSVIQRPQIITLHEVRYSKRKISVQMGCSKTAVHNAIAKYQAGGYYYGRPRKYNPYR